jgi:hypothetical protein
MITSARASPTKAVVNVVISHSLEMIEQMSFMAHPCVMSGEDCAD